MKKSVLTLILISNYIMAIDIKPSISIDYRVDNISFYKIETFYLVDKTEDNIKYLYEFNDIESNSIKIDLDFNKKNNWFFNLGFGYGTINSGSNKNSSFDYTTTDEISSYNKYFYATTSLEGKVSSFDTFFAYRVERDSVELLPKLGFYFDNQNIDMVDKKFIIDDKNLQNTDKSNSNYNAKWYGPYTGITLNYLNSSHLDLSFSLFYHFSNEYKAQVDWYIQDGFAHPRSLTYSFDAVGLRANTNIKYNYKNFSIFLKYNYLDFLGKDGKETNYSITSPNIGNTENFDRSKWDSKSLELGANLRF
jgi:hypothetical protein